MDSDLLGKVEEVFRSKNYVTPWLLSKELGVDLRRARMLYSEFKKYCLSEGLCIEYKGILYRIGSREVSEFLKKEQDKILGKDGLPRLLYVIIDSYEGECIPLKELFERLQKHKIKIPSPYILEALAAIYKRGLIYEKHPLCYKVV